MLRSGCIPKAGRDICSTIKHRKTQAYTQIHFSKKELSLKEKKQVYIQSLRQNLYVAQNKGFYKGESLRQNIQLRDFCRTSEVCIFLSFPIFTEFSGVSVCVKVQDNAELTSNSLIPLNNTPQPASSTFEASWMEHAQWQPVNKSLVEASMAVAHLVRPCTDPE